MNNNVCFICKRSANECDPLGMDVLLGYCNDDHEMILLCHACSKGKSTRSRALPDSSCVEAYLKNLSVACRTTT